MTLTLSTRRALAVAFLAAVLALPLSATWAQAPVDLSTWTQKGSLGSGNWTVAGDGLSVFQSINGNPTYFVSPDTFINTVVEGAFGVESSGDWDDDFIGFVFGWNEPGDNSTDASFLLLNWKQGNQSGTEEGFRLAKVNGTSTPPFASAENDNLPNYDVLGVNTGSTLGWQGGVRYGFSLDYRPDRVTIAISDLPAGDGGNGGSQFGLGGQTIFDLGIGDLPDGTFDGNAFPSGQFGFYNHSQEDVTYVGFTQTDDPVLSTTPADGGTLDFGPTRVGTAAHEQLLVTNAGGAGSTLTGTAGSPSGPAFGGPAPDANFTLGQGANKAFGYSFSPTARGAAADSILVESDDPADANDTVGLAGTGVGPVAEFTADGSPVSDGDVIDFFVADPADTDTVVLRVLNTTPDDDGGDSSLTDLTLVSATISPLSNFSLVGFVPGTVVSAGGFVDLHLQFDPAGAVDTFAGTLTLATDQGGALGVANTTETFDLSAEATPEPATLAVLALGAGAVLRRRRVPTQ